MIAAQRNLLQQESDMTRTWRIFTQSFLPAASLCIAFAWGCVALQHFAGILSV